MIVFELQCSNGHRFEGWFEDGDAFEEQKERGLITCPACESKDVFKVLTPFAIKKTSRATLPASEQPVNIADISRKIGEFLDKNFENVGCDFAKEALKIHYGVSEPRNIRGVSTREEDKMLQEEGVNVVKLPVLEHDKPDSDA